MCTLGSMLLFQQNQQAFREFMAEHQPKVFNTAIGILQNHEEAEEITQDVFIEVYRKAHNFKGQSLISTWMYRITVNKCLDLLRSKKRKKRFAFMTALFESQSAEPVTDAGDFVHPGILAENKEKARYLFAVIEQLPDLQKTAFILSETEGLSYREISEVMQTSVSSVESLLFRAKQNLRKMLADYYKKNK